MGLSNSSAVRLGVSPAAASTPTGVFSQRFEALFPRAGALGCGSVLLPSCSNRFIHTRTWDHPVCQPLPRHMSFPPWLPISAPLTGLGDCFFFNSLVIRLPYSSIFWKFWWFFAFKFVVLLLVVRGGAVYLLTPPSWLEV